MPIRRKKVSPIDLAIEEVFADMNSVNADSDEYSAMVDNLVKLNAVKTQKRSSLGVTPDTWVLALTNLAGIVVILHHEQLNAVSSKAINFVLKMR